MNPYIYKFAKFERIREGTALVHSTHMYMYMYMYMYIHMCNVGNIESMQALV